MEKLKNIPEKTIVVDPKKNKVFLVLKTTGKNMVEDIYKAFEEMQKMAGIEEK